MSFNQLGLTNKFAANKFAANKFGIANKLALTLAGAALAGGALPAHAAPRLAALATTRASGAATAAPNATQKAAMHLGYCLQFLGDRQRRYLADVEGLTSVDEGEATDKYIGALEIESVALRKFEANAVTLTLDDLVKIEGPEKALQSVQPLSKTLEAPLPSNTKKESKDKRVAAILATIDEARMVQDDMTTLQLNLTPILKLQGGDEGLWALELGRALATRRSSALTKAGVDAQAQDVKALLTLAPKTIPDTILDHIRALAPPAPSLGTASAGAGNLAGLLPSDAPAPPTPAARAAERALLVEYGASDVDVKLGNGK